MPSVNVYHLSSSSRDFLDYFELKHDWGAYHVGIELFNTEYSYQYYTQCNDTDTGVFASIPRKAENYIFFEALEIPKTHFSNPLNVNDVEKLIQDLSTTWLSVNYHPITHNCVDFTKHLLLCLGCSYELPQWVDGAVRNSKQNPVIDFIANAYWTVAKSLN
jgi:PPPDE putative peptidase domain